MTRLASFSCRADTPCLLLQEDLRKTETTLCQLLGILIAYQGDSLFTDLSQKDLPSGFPKLIRIHTQRYHRLG